MTNPDLVPIIRARFVRNSEPNDSPDNPTVPARTSLTDAADLVPVVFRPFKISGLHASGSQDPEQ